VSANNFLTSPLLTNIGFTAYIPSTLIYSFGIMRGDSSLTEEDFWDGFNNTVRAIAFKRISIKKDNVLIPTRVIEIKSYPPKSQTPYRFTTSFSKSFPASALPYSVTIVYALATWQNSVAVKLNAAIVS